MLKTTLSVFMSLALFLSLSPTPVAASTADLVANAKLAADYSAKSHGVSMLVMQNGKIIYEDYPNGHSANQAWELASGTKSFSGVAAIAAQEDGILSLDEKVSNTITEWKNDAQKRDITIRQLLTLTSGIEAKAMNPPEYAEAIKSGTVSAPGAEFHYGAAPFQIFGELMCRKLKNDRTMVDYLRERVLTPAGVTVEQWRKGQDHMPFIPQGAHLTAREWAKFGQLILNGGTAENGKQILKPADVQVLFQGTTANPMYGLSWWLNRAMSEQLRTSIRQLTMASDLRYGTPGVPNDLVMAEGLGKQRLYLIPSEHMVVVRQADHIFGAMMSHDSTGFSDNAFMQLLFLGKTEIKEQGGGRAAFAGGRMRRQGMLPKAFGDR